MLEVHELNAFSEFEDLRCDWNQILQRSKDGDIFSTWEWLWCWWKHFGKGRYLKILIAQENDEILSIAPFMLSKYSFLHLGKLSKIELIGTPNADYNNIILFKKPDKCLKAFLNHLKSTDWDLLELRDIREGSASATGLQSISKSGTSKLKLKVGTLCPYIALPDSTEIYRSYISRNMNKNLRRRMRRLREKYRVEVKTHRDFDSIKEAMEEFFKLHLKKWGSRVGAFGSTAFRDFHLDIAEIFNEKDWLGMHFLTANDEPIAAVYSFDYNQKKYGYSTGFDPEFGRYSPGNLLKMRVVEYCIERGFREFDLTRDIEPYKGDWATGVRKNFVATMVNKGLFARIYDWTAQQEYIHSLVAKLGGHLTLGSD